MNLSAVRIFVNDIAAAKEFYVDCLGFGVAFADPDHGVCVLDAGTTQLVVEKIVDDAPEDEQALVGRFTGVSFAVDDIVSKHADMRTRGVEFSGKPEQQYWGGWLATFRDPAGNELQLVQTAASASHGSSSG